MDGRTSPTRRDRRRSATRAEILAAARELLLEVGPEELSLRQVARRADFSPAALYNYFSNKDELVASLFAEAFERLDTYVRRVSRDLSPEERVVELALAYMDFAQDNPMDLRCMLLTASLDLPPSSGKALGLDAARLLGETFREGMEEGVFSPDVGLSAAEMAFGVWALVHGMVSLAFIDLKEVSEEVSADPRQVIGAFIQLFVK